MDTASRDTVLYASPAGEHFDPLRDMARASFSETFGHLYEAGPFHGFLDESYGPGGKMDRDLHNPSVQWQVALHRSEPIGYAKLTPLRAPAPAPAIGAVELQQIYVQREWHGSGVATHLMEWAIGLAHTTSAPEIYLTVFNHNARAKRFYTRHGFTEVGRCTFTLGDQIDDDRIWRRRLRP